MEDFGTSFLDTSIKVFRLYKKEAESAIAQLDDKQLFTAPSPESNSVAVIVKHLWGNMLSRWTDFLTTDGEKDWRDRDSEFEINDNTTREELMKKWEEGWECMFKALEPLTPADLGHKVYIRGEEYTVIKAIQRQLAHYSSHIGQIVYIAKLLKGKDWKTLSIPKGQSKLFNEKMFGKKQ
jgi:hypothetical protein